MKKKLLCLTLGAAMLLSLAACGGPSEGASNPSPTPAAVSAPAPSEAPAPSAPAVSEDEAWKQESAYGQTLTYFAGDACCAGPAVAEHLGYYEEAGLKVEGYKGTSYTEALGTNAAQIAIGHIATMLVPSTNGVDLSFVGGAHIGCKTLYVLGDSEYQTTADLKGLKVSVPNGIGASDYNITARLFDADGINPLTDVNLVQVESGACIAAMQNGEIAAALLSDTFAYDMVKDGTLRSVRSLLDEDFAQEACCIIAMNTTFVKENPITSKKLTECVKKAHEWMRTNPEEAAQLLLDLGLSSGELQKNIDYVSSLQFGLTDDFTETALKTIVDDYIRLGFITSMDSVDDVMAKVWTPTAPEA